MKIRLLDISGIFWRVFRVIEASGKPIGTVSSEVVTSLRQHAARGGADYVVACCDAPNCFRREIAEEYKALFQAYKGYKSHRPEKDAAMMAALNRVIDEIEQDGVPIMKVDTFEADDVIATIAEWAVNQGHDVEIVSEDKDLLQLVQEPDPNDPDDHTPRVVVVRRDGTHQDYAACVKRMGVPPSLVAQMLALMGDKGDGVIGLHGIGKETAAELLWGKEVKGQWQRTPFKNFDAIVDAAVNEQVEVEKTLCRWVHKGVVNNKTDEVIAKRLKITLDEVAAFKARQPDEGEDIKTQFASDVRKSLIANAAAYDIGLRLTTLRRDVPLDFAQVTAPRTPKPKPHTDTWKEQRERAAEISKTIEEEERQDTMQEIVETSQPVAAPTKPIVIDAPQPSQPPPAAATQTTALTVRKPPRAQDFQLELEPRTYEEATLVAEHVSDSKIFKDIGSPQQAMVLILLGRKFGLSAVDSMRMIHMIEGKPCMSAQLIVGIVQKSGMAEYFEIEELTNDSATWVTKRRGARREQRWTFTLADARAARLGGIYDKAKNLTRDTFDPNSNWAKHPKVMCMWRAAVFLARAVYTDLVGGLYMPDELREVDVEIDGNPPMFGEIESAA